LRLTDSALRPLCACQVVGNHTLYRLQKNRQAEWLQNRGPGTGRDALHDVRMAGHENDRNARFIGQRHQIGIEATWQRAIQQHRVNATGSEALYGGGGVFGAAGSIQVVKRIRYDLRDEGVVFHDQNVRAISHSAPVITTAKVPSPDGDYARRRNVSKAPDRLIAPYLLFANPPRSSLTAVAAGRLPVSWQRRARMAVPV
jgi:hypothetical protein